MPAVTQRQELICAEELVQLDGPTSTSAPPASRKQRHRRSARWVPSRVAGATASDSSPVACLESTQHNHTRCWRRTRCRLQTARRRCRPGPHTLGYLRRGRGGDRSRSGFGRRGSGSRAANRQHPDVCRSLRLDSQLHPGGEARARSLRRMAPVLPSRGHLNSSNSRLTRRSTIRIQYA